MNWTIICYFFAFILASGGISAQVIGFEEIDDTKVTPWLTRSIKEYQNVYHFGDSEGESDLLLLTTKNGITGQIRYADWDNKKQGWISLHKNLSNIIIEGNCFYSDQTDGEFVIYSGNKTIKGLKVYNSWSGLIDESNYEIGPVSYEVSLYFNGIYPQASLRKLTSEELYKLSKAELKIMRNEVFARYGYIFQKNGEMHQYFINQEWYIPQLNKVDMFLTDLEKENIQLIKRIENQ